MSTPDDELTSTPRDLLSSWKEIAAHMKRDVSTVRRWERSEGLPVHRQQHADRGTVYARRAELDAWFQSRLSTPQNGARSLAQARQDEIAPTVEGVPTTFIPPSTPWRTPSALLMLGALIVAVSHGESSTRLQPLPADTTQSVAAMRAYERGLELVNLPPDGNWEAAVPHFQEAVRLDPTFASAHVWLAWALGWVADPQTDQIDLHLEQAFRLGQSLGGAERLWIEGSYFSHKRQFQQARIAYAALVEMRPNDFWGWQNFGGALVRVRDYSGAAVAFKRSAALRPDFYQAQARAAMMLAAVGDVEGAEDYNNAALTMVEQNLRPHRANFQAWTRCFPALAAWQRDDPERAAELAIELVRQLPQLSEPVQERMEPLLSELLLALGKNALAGNLMSRYRQDEHAEAWIALIQFDRPALERALTALEDASGLLYSRVGQLTNARAAMAQDQRGATAHLIEADIALAEGQFERALKVARDAQGLGLDDYSYWVSRRILAEAYVGLGDKDAAIVTLVKALNQSSRGFGPSGAFAGQAWVATLAHAAALAPEEMLGPVSLRDRLKKLMATADPDHPFRQLAFNGTLPSGLRHGHDHSSQSLALVRPRGRP